MTARTQLLLYKFLWIGERMLRPTLGNAMCSFEEWASRDGLWRDIHRLEAQAYLESGPGKNRMDRVVRLTEKGRRAALGGIEPPVFWNRPWDGKWRVLFFDIPETERSKRDELRTVLRGARFGAVQRSVWLSPDPLDGFSEELRSLVAECGVLMALEGVTCLGECQRDIVAAAWDFGKVARAYEKWSDHAARLPGDTATTADRLAWGKQERALWMDCLAVDPLLPRPLWPSDYAGEAHWRTRLDALARAARLPGEFPIQNHSRS